MKLSGTAALYAQLKEHEAAIVVTKRQIALAEEFGGEAPAKKTRKKRTPKPNGTELSATAVWSKQAEEHAV